MRYSPEPSVTADSIFDQRRAGGFDGHARQHRAGGIPHDAGDRRLRERNGRGEGQMPDRTRHHTLNARMKFSLRHAPLDTKRNVYVRLIPLLTRCKQQFLIFFDEGWWCPPPADFMSPAKAGHYRCTNYRSERIRHFGRRRDPDALRLQIFLDHLLAALAAEAGALVAAERRHDS